jgi:AcrR family transcriptional regulator
MKVSLLLLIDLTKDGRMPKQARSRLTHERILTSAATEFAQYGYHAASLQGVANRIDLTKGALYGHFVSKEQLATALTGELDEVLRAVAAEIRGSEGPQAIRSFTCSLAERIESDVRINAAVRLVLDKAQISLELFKFLEGMRRHGALADLAVAMLVGAYYTAASTDRRDLSARVRAMWDALPHAEADERADEAEDED